jgi:hypothetical protein
MSPKVLLRPLVPCVAVFALVAASAGPPNAFPESGDHTPPKVTIKKKGRPAASTTNQRAIFRFRGVDRVGKHLRRGRHVTFKCSLDRRRFSRCSSPRIYRHLSVGRHRFRLKGRDRSGNVSRVASYRWTVTAVPGAPAPSPAPDSTPLRSRNCMPDPSACGFPDLENTGVTAGASLTPVNGVVKLETPGMVFENRLVRGSIHISAPNVTVRNVKLVNTDDYYAIRILPWENAGAGAVIEHVEIDLGGKMGDPSGGDLKGIAFDGYTARNVFIHNGTDCAHFGENVVIEDSLCVAGPDADGDAWPDQRSFCSGPQHFDGFQSDGGNNIVLRHNTIRNPCGQTSAILMSSNTSPIENFRIEDNLMAGGGWTLYCAGNQDKSRVSNATVTGNRFAKTWFPKGGNWGPAAYCEPGLADVFERNVWDDTGAPIR